MPETLTVALVHEVFHGEDGPDRLRRRLAEARAGGAELALLPELPLDPWVPAGRTPRDEDAEDADGARARLLSAGSAAAGLAVLGGAIVRDPETGRRHNRALLFDAAGRLLAHYDKLHVPNEDGFWEAEHYDGGDAAPRPVEGLALPLGLQICSDLFRPQGCHLLGACGADAILAPRATPAASYDRWRTIIRANAMSSGAYVLSTNRPFPEAGVPIGGPSLAVAPDGEVLAESTDPMALVILEHDRVKRARAEYPGYLPIRADLYAQAWESIRKRGHSPFCADGED